MEYWEKFRYYSEIAFYYSSNIWRHNIVTVSGSDIQVGNILLSILILVLGLKYLKTSIKKIKSYIRQKFDGDEQASHMLEKASGYVMVFIFIVLILEISNIPISSLAFIGGALALGIGLGAQNLINNFISSIIVAIEKPVKVGDTIEVEGIIGTVTALGARCVIINTDSNLEVLVPTSKLLQNSFVNWSLNNNLIKKRIEVKITPKNLSKSGRAIDCAEGKRILEEALQKNETIASAHDPIVYLLNVSHDTFTYEISYWHELSPATPMQSIQSFLSFALTESLSKYPIKFSISHIVDAKKTHAQDDSFSSNLAEDLL